MKMTQADYNDRKRRVDDGTGDDEDARLVKLYENEGFAEEGKAPSDVGRSVPIRAGEQNTTAPGQIDEQARRDSDGAEHREPRIAKPTTRANSKGQPNADADQPAEAADADATTDKPAGGKSTGQRGKVSN